MSRRTSKVLWAITGILLILGGIVCLNHPQTGLAAISFLLGILVLLAGITDIFIFIKGRELMVGSAWFLVDGILTILLSLFILFDQMFTAMTLPFILGMWLLFSGITKFVQSLDLKHLGVSGWGWMTALGILLAVVGFISFMEPVVSLLTISALVGVLLIFQGFSAITRAFFSDRWFM